MRGYDNFYNHEIAKITKLSSRKILEIQIAKIHSRQNKFLRILSVLAIISPFKVHFLCIKFSFHPPFDLRCPTYINLLILILFTTKKAAEKTVSASFQVD